MFRVEILRFLKDLLKVVLLGFFLASCNQVAPSRPTATSPVNTQIPGGTAVQVTGTLSPSPTSSKQVVVLVAPAQADAVQVSALQAALTELAAASRLDFQQKTGLAGKDLDPSVKLVVALQTDPGLGSLIKAAPQVQFVAIGIPGLQPQANLSLIGPEGFRLDQQAFLAGYLASILTDDFRVGVLTQPVDSGGQQIQDAYINGVRFFCGLCRPAHPPYLAYPQAYAIASPGDQASWREAADNLLQASVTAIYISPASSSPELLDYLYHAKIDLIGGETPPDDVRSQWIATILPDSASALKQLWPDLLAGKGGAQLSMPMKLADTASGLLNAARQRLVDQTLDDLVNDRIDPNPVPEP